MNDSSIPTDYYRNSNEFHQWDYAPVKAVIHKKKEFTLNLKSTIFRINKTSAQSTGDLKGNAEENRTMLYLCVNEKTLKQKKKMFVCCFN